MSIGGDDMVDYVRWEIQAYQGFVTVWLDGTCVVGPTQDLGEVLEALGPPTPETEDLAALAAAFLLALPRHHEEG